MRGARIIRSVAYLRRRWPIYLAVGAIFRDEAPYLPEWIRFHMDQGVERFYLYDNASSDGWRAALEPFREVVELHSWPASPGQLSAYADCIRRHRLDTRWIAFIDTDEFLFSPTGRSIPEALSAFRTTPAVGVNWRLYGTSGHVESPAGGVLENYTMRAPDDFPRNQHIKSIVFPAMVSTLVENPHIFRSYGPTLGERRDPVSSSLRDPPTADILRINHYYTRSAAEYAAKHDRPKADGSDPWPPDFDALNAVSDPILRDGRRGAATSD